VLIHSPSATDLLDADWCLQAPALVSDITCRHAQPIAKAYFQFGRALLELETDCTETLNGLLRSYGECAVPCEVVQSGPRVRCSVWALDALPLTLMTFHQPESPDAIGLALGLLENAKERYVERETPLSGWRIIADEAHPAHPLLLTRGGDSLVDRRQVSPRFLVNFVVSAAMRAQQDVLFVHAASIGIHGAGVLLVGAGRAGKTTLSLALAARGHSFFGDDVAAIHRSTLDLLPFRQAASIRPGPRARIIEQRLTDTCYETDVFADGTSRIQVPVGELFPDTGAQSAPLRHVFFLRRFCARPALESFVPTLRDLEILKRLSFESTVLAAWGVSPGGRLMKFVSFLKLLANAQCYFLDVGQPDETAELIESATEDIWV
jgi:hypothetical protein